VRPIQRELEAQMNAAAQEERFEDARATATVSLRCSTSSSVRPSSGSRSGPPTSSATPRKATRAVVQIFPLRGGKMVDRHSFHLENVEGQDLTTVLEAFGLEYYGSAPSVPPLIVVPREAGDLSALAEFLSEKPRREGRGALGGAR